MSVFYERLAPWYDAYNEAIGKDAAREVAALVQVLADHDVALGSVLDVACGTGRHLVHLRQHATEVAGSDVSAAMLAVAADRLPEVPLHEADFRELDRAIAAMADHVAPGGTLLVEPWLTPEVVVEDGMRDAAGVSVGDAAVSRTAGLAATWVEHDTFPRGLVLGRRSHP